MKKISKLALITFSLLSLGKYASAQIIELDMQDADKCRQQITEATDAKPIVIDYSPTCGACEMYKPIYEKVAANHPERTFFKAKEWEASDAVKAKCLQETGISGVPRTKVIFKITNPQTGEQFITNALRVETGAISEQQLEKLIGNYSPNDNYNMNNSKTCFKHL